MRSSSSFRSGRAGAARTPVAPPTQRQDQRGRRLLMIARAIISEASIRSCSSRLVAAHPPLEPADRLGAGETCCLLCLRGVRLLTPSAATSKDRNATGRSTGRTSDPARETDPADVENWRRGRVPHLERVTQAGPGKLSTAIRACGGSCSGAGCGPSQTEYRSWTRTRTALRFSKSDGPHIEQAYRTHWVGSGLPVHQHRSLARSHDAATSGA